MKKILVLAITSLILFSTFPINISEAGNFSSAESRHLGAVLKWKYDVEGIILFSPLIGEDGTVYVVSDLFGTLYAINPDGTLKWKYETGLSVYHPTVLGEDGVIYIAGSDPNGLTYLFAINPDGTLKWKFKVERKYFKIKFVDASFSNKYGIIYVLSVDGDALGEMILFAINLDGTLKWKFSAENVTDASSITFYVTAGVFRLSKIMVGEDGTVYLDHVSVHSWVYGKGGYYMYAVDKDGTIKWYKQTVSTEYIIWHAMLGRNALYVLATSGTYRDEPLLIALSLQDGTEKWIFRGDDYWNRRFWGESSPVIGSDDTIYITLTSGHLEDYPTPFSIVYAINLDGTLKWKYTFKNVNLKDVSLVWLSAGEDGTLYMFTGPEKFWGEIVNPARIYAIGPDGSLKWSYEWIIGYDVQKKYWNETVFEGSVINFFPQSDFEFAEVNVKEGMINITVYEGKSAYGLLPPYFDFKSPRITEDDMLYIPIYISWDVLPRGSGLVQLKKINVYFYHIISPNGKVEQVFGIFGEDWDVKEIKNRMMYSVSESKIYAIAISTEISLEETILTVNVNPSRILEKADVTVTVSGRLTDESGIGLSSKTINICRDDSIIGNCVTDSNGYYIYEWKNVYLERGLYSLTARFEGDSNYAASSASATLTVAGSVLSMTLSEGWHNKQLFAPFFIRSEDGKFIIGIFNKRDMWYLVRVYRRMPDKSWAELFPWELPYLAPYSELTFVYPYELKEGDEIKIEVLNEPNDNTLCGLILLDFAMRALIGIPLPRRFPEIADASGFKNKLTSLYRDFLKPVFNDLKQGLWKKALTEICKKLAETEARDLVGSILYDWEVNAPFLERYARANIAGKLMDAAGAVAKGLVGVFVNWPQWHYFLQNINMEPFREDAIFTVKRTMEQEPTNLMVTESLTIVQNAPYYSGETIDVRFSLRNRGEAPISISVLTVKVNGHDGEAMAFTPKNDIRLNPSEVYNYRGKLTLSNYGSYHLFIAYKTMDGKWVTDVPTEVGVSNAIDIFVNPLPDEIMWAELCSPGELRIYDPQGRVTGLVNGEESNEIPHSFCIGNIIVVFTPKGPYRFQVAGTSKGTYNLTIARKVENETILFTSTSIPLSPKEIHQYTIDWEALAKGDKGVNVQVDFEGDGKFDQTITSGKTLTYEGFPRPAESLDIKLIVAAAVIVLASALSILILRRKRRLVHK